MSNKLSQKEAVVSAVSSVFGGQFVSGETNVRSLLTSDTKNQVIDQVTTMIQNGEVEYSKSSSASRQEIRRYVSGMVDNHLRKAKELNGGQKYVAQSTGSTRTSDPTLKELKKLLATYEEGSDEHDKVLEAISSREEAINAEKAESQASRARTKKLSGIDVSVLPAELAGLVDESLRA